MTNDEIAETLQRVAELLELRGDGAFRVRSYQRAAEVIRQADQPVEDLVAREGAAGLTQMPGIGDRLAGAIQELVETGRLRMLDELEAESTPEQLLAKVPGIGETLARRLHEQLGIDSLEELERAAHDGRLDDVEGLGPTRAEGIRDALAGMLSRSVARRARQRVRETTIERPPVDVLLDVDQEYRDKAARDQLKKIAPRRFNPEGEAWLPVLRTRRGDWSVTALYSNTARAHELGKTHDWVVLYYSRDGREDQCTVVTATSGKLKGRRVIRGREAECREHYGV